jgi:hypothetical protein
LNNYYAAPLVSLFGNVILLKLYYLHLKNCKPFYGFSTPSEFRIHCDFRQPRMLCGAIIFEAFQASFSRGTFHNFKFPFTLNMGETLKTKGN